MKKTELTMYQAFILTNLYREFMIHVAPSVTAVMATIDYKIQDNPEYPSNYEREAMERAWGEFVEAKRQFAELDDRFSSFGLDDAEGAYDIIIQ